MLASVLGAICFISYRPHWFSPLPENPKIELIWTIVPALTLVALGGPSLSILYQGEHAVDRKLAVNITGHQWYWSYRVADFHEDEFDRFIKPIEDCVSGNFRGLDVDNRLVLPFLTTRQLAVSSTDVLHSWALPAISLKADANPGRINQIPFARTLAGVFFGQCSELCGANHSFIPVVVEVTTPQLFSAFQETELFRLLKFSKLCTKSC